MSPTTRVQQVRKSRRIKAKKDAEEETAEAKTEEPVENGKNSNRKKIGTEPRNRGQHNGFTVLIQLINCNCLS